MTTTLSSEPGNLPILYSFRRCPFAMRARLALAVSGQTCELREVVLRDKPAALLQASPKATVPVLVASDGRVLDQSLAIMRWALERSDPEAWLGPRGQGAGDTNLLVAECDGTFKHHLDRYKYPGRYVEDVASDGRPGRRDENGNGSEEAIAQSAVDHRAEAGRFVAQLDARLHLANYVCGDHASLADMAIAPFVRQFAATDAAWFAAQPWPRVRHWLGAWMGSALFAGVMHRYPPWHGGDAVTRFP